MQPPSYEDFILKQDGSAVTEHSKEEFHITECPTPGCRNRDVKPIMSKGVITGFTCSGGCRYSVRRNPLTGNIDYYQLDAFNHYRLDPDVSGYRVTANGLRHIDWF